MSGFTSPNHTQVPNDLFTMMASMGEAELKIVLCAIRQIFGYHKDKPEAISYSQFEIMTGLKRAAVATGIKAAIKRGVLRIAGKGTRGINLYELVVNDQSDNQTSDQFEKQTSEDVTSLKSEPVTSLKSEHTKESSKERKDIADGKVIDITTVSDSQDTKTKTRSAKQAHNDLLVDTLGKAIGVEAKGDDYGIYARNAGKLEKAGIPMDEFERYIKRLRIKAKEQGNWAVTVRSIVGSGRPSEYVASRDKYQHEQKLKLEPRKKTQQEIAEDYMRRMIMGEPLDETA